MGESLSQVPLNLGIGGTNDVGPFWSSFHLLHPLSFSFLVSPPLPISSECVSALRVFERTSESIKVIGARHIMLGSLHKLNNRLGSHLGRERLSLEIPSFT